MSARRSAISSSLQDRLVNGLNSITRLTRSEAQALRQLPLSVVSLEAYEDVVREGESLTKSCLLVEGLLCRYKIIAGKRQILSVHLPGDVPDLQSLHLDEMDYSLGALTASTVAFIRHQHIRATIASEPGLGAAFWRHTLVDAAIERAWLASLGRRSSRERVAHLYCEVFARLLARNLTDRESFALPMTQIDMADAVGLSQVHLNRTIQELRRSGVLVQRGRYYGFEDWTLLQETADFDPAYLNLRQAP